MLLRAEERHDAFPAGALGRASVSAAGVGAGIDRKRVSTECPGVMAGRLACASLSTLLCLARRRLRPLEALRPGRAQVLQMITQYRVYGAGSGVQIG